MLGELFSGNAADRNDIETRRLGRLYRSHAQKQDPALGQWRSHPDHGTEGPVLAGHGKVGVGDLGCDRLGVDRRR